MGAAKAAAAVSPSAAVASTEVVGEGYLLGGRTETRLQPSTNGPAIPGGAFTPAYNAVVARVAQAASR